MLRPRRIVITRCNRVLCEIIEFPDIIIRPGALELARKQDEVMGWRWFFVLFTHEHNFQRFLDGKMYIKQRKSVLAAIVKQLGSLESVPRPFLPVRNDICLSHAGSLARIRFFFMGLYQYFRVPLSMMVRPEPASVDPTRSMSMVITAPCDKSVTLSTAPVPPDR